MTSSAAVAEMDPTREAEIDWGNTADEPPPKGGRPPGPARQVTCLNRHGEVEREHACGKCRRCKRRESMRLWRERNQDGN